MPMIPPDDPTRTAAPPAGPGADTTLPDAPAPAGDKPAPAVPGYEVRGEIARGGMGRVLAARDPVLDREVAIKVLLPVKNLQAAAARFVTESKVTAQLPHPAIPPVYELGTLPDGSPYLAMKLIRGKTLAALLRERPTPAADLPRWVQAFEQVCQAVGFAHDKGVIHRDLKPSNVMVGDFGEVQVMDWGLARVSAGRERERPEILPPVAHAPGPPAHTATGAVLGTPAYMAPEQARGEPVDARADVFALGGILCAILTGSSPYTGSSNPAVLARARAADLAGAFEWLDACGADAELIALCKRCLSPAPADRPADGRAVADLVAAYRAGVEDRLRRAEREAAAAEARAAEQRRKRRWQRALAAAVGLLLLGGAGFAWWQDRQATAREADQRAARQRIEVLLPLAAQMRKEYRFDAARDALAQAREQAENYAPDLLPTVEQAQADLDFVVALDAIRMRRSTWVAEPGGRGRFDDARAPGEYRAAFAARGLDVAGADPSAVAAAVRGSTVREDVVVALDDWAVFETDESVTDRVLEVARRADPDPWRDRFRDPAVRGSRMALGLIARSADPAALPPGTVTALSELMARRQLAPGRLLLAAQLAHPDDFLIPFTLGLYLSGVKGDRPAVAQHAVAHYRTARAIRPGNYAVVTNLGAELLFAGDLDAAVRFLRDVVRRNPNDPRAHINLGYALHAKRDITGSIAIIREAIRLDPADAMAHANLSCSLRDLRDPGALPEAVAAAREAVRLDPAYPLGHYNLGLALYDTGKVKEAIACYEAAIRLDREQARFHDRLAVALRVSGRVKDAIAAARVAARLDPTDHNPPNTLGLALWLNRELDEAQTCFREAIRLNPGFVEAHVNLGSVWHDRKNVDEAIRWYERALAIDPNYANAHNNLGLALATKGNLDGAVAAYRKAIHLNRRHREAHFNLGNALTLKKKYAAAADAYRKALEFEPDNVTVQYALGTALWNQGAILWRRGDVAGAAAAFREAGGLYPAAPKAHLDRGNALRTKGNLDGAVVAFRAAVHLRPMYTEAHFYLGLTLAAKKEFAAAAQALGEAAKLDPGNATVHYNLGIVRNAAGDVDGAVAAYREAIRLARTYPEPHCNLGRTLQRQGKLVEAAAMLRRGHELGSRRKGWPYPSAEWVAECERLLEENGLIAPPPREAGR